MSSEMNTTRELAARVRALEEELGEARARLAEVDAVARELQRSQELSRRLIEAMPGGVVHVTGEGAVRTANSEAQRILGLGWDELTRRYTRDFDTETIFEDGTPCRAEEYPVSRALVTGEPQPPMTIGVRRPDGGTSWAVFTAVPVKDEDGGTIGAIVTFIDISSRLDLERDLVRARKLEGIGRLAGGIAHDFNNLLTVILGNLRTVDRTLAATDPRREDITSIREAALHAASLTRQLLAFASKQVVRPRVIDVREAIDRTAGLLGRIIGEDVELALALAPDLWPVEIDPNQLEQMLVNLAANARDAMPLGGRLEISGSNVGVDGRELLVLRVKDTGVGMDPEQLEHAFEPFFTTKDAAAGTGLGLASCYGIVTQAGGTISVASEPGAGTCFEIRLPRARAEVRTAEAATERPPLELSPESCRTILVVEDDPLVRRIVHRILERVGHRVLEAIDPPATLDLVANHDGPIDLVLTDVVMPGMTGPELVERIGRDHPEAKVLYMSGYAFDALAARGLPVERIAFLKKPFEPEGLLRRVEAVLGAAEP